MALLERLREVSAPSRPIFSSRCSILLYEALQCMCVDIYTHTWICVLINICVYWDICILCCSVLRCVVVCCGVLQCVAVCYRHTYTHSKIYMCTETYAHENMAPLLVEILNFVVWGAAVGVYVHIYTLQRRWSACVCTCIYRHTHTHTYIYIYIYI